MAQLHSAASNAPCPGQEPSKIVPVSEGTTFGVIAGANTATPSVASLECASMTLCGTIKKHIIEHFHHKKPVPPKPEPKPQPHPDYHPVPKRPSRSRSRSPTQTTIPSLPCPPTAVAVAVDTMDTTDSSDPVSTTFRASTEIPMVSCSG
ncbi:BRD4-interacting chromatin-remodeling complex-associated protein-like isoform X1 [Triticum aestivum]|uniref:BRD4-interacting chromatin-remodeling complex-associated protein-like isoform X1 n=1 Tax=Triticum aestivum TaxID=4565 RepID=UPI001D013661|nr:BRD4-interacting chromatin-remodeling complex-associated protein-like isoform X1 [Triticum aestivum]